MARTRDEALHKRRKSEILDAAAKCFYLLMSDWIPVI